MGKKPLILIAVCTRNLAVFEANCARGIAQLSFPQGYRYELLLVENRSEASGALNTIGADIPVRYFLEKQLGLSAARNRVFTEAQKRNADWLALLDDDVVPMDGWLEEYVRAMQSMPDVVLLYWNMPVMSGIEYLRALRVTDEGKKPIVVFCTTENDMSHIQEGIAAGANEYIMKPFDSDIIQSKFVQTGVL